MLRAIPIHQVILISTPTLRHGGNSFLSPFLGSFLSPWCISASVPLAALALILSLLSRLYRMVVSMNQLLWKYVESKAINLEIRPISCQYFFFFFYANESLCRSSWELLGAPWNSERSWPEQAGPGQSFKGAARGGIRLKFVWTGGS